MGPDGRRIGEEEKTGDVLFVRQGIRYGFVAVSRTSVSQGNMLYINVSLKSRIAPRLVIRPNSSFVMNFPFVLRLRLVIATNDDK